MFNWGDILERKQAAKVKKNSDINNCVSKNLAITFYIVFAVSFSWLFLNVIFNNHTITETNFKYNPLIVIISVLGWMSLMYFIYNLFNKSEQWFFKRKYIILSIIILVLFLVQLSFGGKLAINTDGDVRAIYEGAINWAETGSIGTYQNYFYIFPNNIGGLLLLKNLFYVAKLLNINYLVIAIIFNIFLIDITFILIFLTCNKIFGIKKAMLALFLCLCYLPLYFYSPVFYTDTLSICFVTMSWYLYLLAKKVESTYVRIAYFIAMGIVCAIGTEIKFTVIISIIAILIEIILFNNIKKYIIPVACSILSIVVIMTLFNLYIYSTILDRNTAQNNKVPYVHWIFMGLQGNGTYNNKDLEYTLSFKDPQKRFDSDVKMIKSRLNGYGFFGYLSFLNRKGVHSFGSGVYGVYEILDDNPLHKTDLHEFCLKDGKYFSIFNNVSQGFHVLIFILIILSAISELKNKNSSDVKLIPLLLAIFGLYLFLLIWEANPRYLLNYIPVFIICAVQGIDFIYDHLYIKKLIIPRDKQNKHKVI